MSHRGKLTMRTITLPLVLAERPRTQGELAHEFGVDKKTIKRHIDELTPYFPITEERDGREVLYRFHGDYRPPSLTPLELATLLLAQEAIAANGLLAHGSPFHDHARTLLLKVRAALPRALHAKLDALSGVYGNAATPAKNFAAHADAIDDLTNAAMETRQVRLRYHSLTNDAVTERIVDPLAVYFDPDGATIKLAAYDHKQQRIAPFAIDRILALTVTRERFRRPPDFRLEDFLTENCFNGIHGAPVKVVLRAHGVTARIFAERSFHLSQRIIEHTARNALHDEAITIEMNVAAGRGLVRFILGWAPDVEVLEPAELRSEIAAAHQQARSRYADISSEAAPSQKNSKPKAVARARRN